MDSIMQQGRVVLFSYGFKYGVPTDVNVLFDVRFLPNPYWVDGMREKTGQDGDVSEYVLKSVAGRDFLTHLEPLLEILVKGQVIAEKKTLRIAIGCTGGRHRSVAVAEKLAVFLRGQIEAVNLFHRDMARDGNS
jgi:UPF0042 nucleotide-binding protein